MGGEPFGKGSWLHSAAAANEKHIARGISKATQSIRHGGLTAVEFDRSARDAPMPPNGIEYDEQVEIDFIIHNGNI